MPVSVIIAASGSGQRMGGDVPKQFMFMGGRPVLARTLDAFNRLGIVGDIVVAAPADYVRHTWEIARQYSFEKVQAVVPGGANRAESIFAALKELPWGSMDATVLIHDGVRPFVSEELIMAVADAAREHGAAIAGTPVTDTIKEVGAGGKITSTPDRSSLWRVQTPQGFTYELIMAAYAQGEADGVFPHVTDDSMLVERMGKPVIMVESSPGNIKITTPEDMALGEILLKSASSSRA